MVLLIDGYNLMHALSFSLGDDLEEGRRYLLDLLGLYKRKRGHRVIVVFDGTDKVGLGEEKGRMRGVEVLFTRRGEKADDALVRLASRYREGCVLITSDRSVREGAGRYGTFSFSSQDFKVKLWWVQYSVLKGEEEPDEVQQPSPRLSKKARRRMRVWNKL